MMFYDINYDQDHDITVPFQVDEDSRFLLCKVSGTIKNGSKGNTIADYLFEKTCQ
ncbi:hypothetical protein [Dokdonia sp.]|uniref:hypothetical protein n=1 Tax=Dokdonia sp. TaxID=2024995 RepID=UPI0032641617